MFLRKFQLSRVKGFKIFLQSKDLKAIFPANKLNYSSFLFFQAMTGLKILFINFNTNQDTTHRFLKETITNWVWNANNLQGVSSGILCVFPAWSFLFDNPLYKSIVNSLNDGNICFQHFKISQSVFNFLW